MQKSDFPGQGYEIFMSIEGGPQNVSLYNDSKFSPVKFTVPKNLTQFGKKYTFYHHPFNAIARNPRRSEYY